MKRLLPYALLGATIGTAWGIASRFLAAWLYLAITTAALAAIILWAVRTLRQLRVMKRELDDSLRQLEEVRRTWSNRHD